MWCKVVGVVTFELCTVTPRDREGQSANLTMVRDIVSSLSKWGGGGVITGVHLLQGVLAYWRDHFYYSCGLSTGSGLLQTSVVLQGCTYYGVRFITGMHLLTAHY